MRFQVNDQDEIRWIRNPEEFEVGDVVKQIKDAGKWDELLVLEQDEEGVVDCDALYERLRHEAPEALLSVGLHYTEASATAAEVVKAWAEKYAGMGLKVSYCADGKTPSGLQLYDYGERYGGIELEFEVVNETGNTSAMTLSQNEVFELVKAMAHGNANTGAWTGTDPETATFEMWSDHD